MFFSHGMSFSGMPLICVAIGFHIRLGTKVRLAGLACTGRLCVCAPGYSSAGRLAVQDGLAPLGVTACVQVRLAPGRAGLVCSSASELGCLCSALSAATSAAAAVTKN